VETTSGWQFGFGGLELEDVRLHYVDPLLDYKFRVPWVSLGEMEMWDADADTRLRARLELKDASLEVDGTLRPFAEQFQMGLDVKAVRIPIAPQVMALATDSFENVEGNYDLSGRLSLRQAEAGIQVDFEGGLDMRQVSATGEGLAPDLEAVSWDGILALNVGEETVGVKVGGQTKVGPATLVLGDEGMRSSVSALGWDGDVNYESDAHGQLLELNGKLTGSTLQMGVVPTQSASGDGGLDLELDSLSVTSESLSFKLDEAGQKLEWSGVVDLSSLEFKSEGQSAGLAGMKWDGSVEAAAGANQKTDWSADGELMLTGGEAGDGNGRDATVGRFEWEGRASSAEDSFAGLGLSGRVDIDSLAVRRDGWQVGRVGTLEGSLTEDSDGGRILGRDITVSALDLLQRDETADSGEPGHVVTIAEVTVSEIGLTDERVEVGEVSIGAADIWLKTAADGKLEIRQMTGGDQGDAGETAAVSEPAAAMSDDGEFHFSIASVRTTEAARITYLDPMVKPAVRLEFTDMVLDVGRLDSSRPETDTKVSLHTRLGRYGKLGYEGTLRPLAPQLSATGIGEVRGMDLNLFDGYARRNTGYRVDSGTLRADIDVDILSGEVDSNAAMIISQLDVEAIVSEEDDDTVADLGMPLGAALDLLKDDNDTITLDVPMTGNINEMKAGLGHALRIVLNKGVMVGVRTAATTMFAPLWPALAVSKLVDVASAARFKPVTFAAGDAALAGDQLSYLSDVAKLLADRPKISLEICGRTAATDLPVLLPEANPEALSDEQSATLADLALTRQLAVKDFLLGKDIEAHRVATCAVSEHPQGIEGLPRVEVGL
jgi:hypothetical protein